MKASQMSRTTLQNLSIGDNSVALDSQKPSARCVSIVLNKRRFWMMKAHFSRSQPLCGDCNAVVDHASLFPVVVVGTCGVISSAADVSGGNMAIAQERLGTNVYFCQTCSSLSCSRLSSMSDFSSIICIFSSESLILLCDVVGGGVGLYCLWRFVHDRTHHLGIPTYILHLLMKT